MKEKWKIDHEDWGAVFETILKESAVAFLGRCSSPQRYQVCRYGYDKAVEGRWEVLETINGEVFLADTTKTTPKSDNAFGNVEDSGGQEKLNH